MLNKGAFWAQSNYYGVDITGLHMPAIANYFSQVQMLPPSGLWLVPAHHMPEQSLAGWRLNQLLPGASIDGAGGGGRR